MTQTKEFRNMLRRFRRNFGIELGTERAEQFARENKIPILQPRKKYKNKFKRQRSNAFDFPEFYEFW